MFMGEFALELISNSLLDLLQQLCRPRSVLKYRKNGYLILEAIMKTKDLEAWETEKSYKTLVFSMVQDPNWRIRKQFCTFTYRLFEPLKEFETVQNGALSPLSNSSDKMCRIDDKLLVQRQNTLKSEYVSLRARNVYRVLKSGWASGLFEILTDNHPQVVMEALRVMAEYSYAFRKRNFQDYFLPHFTRMLNNVTLKTASFSFKQSFAKYSGLMLHTLHKLGML
jgi:hypothetical protein